MAVFFKINSKSIHAPSSISFSYELLDKEERTMDGTMVVDIIGQKKKITVDWEYLSKADMKTLSEEVSGNTFVTVTAHDTVSGELTTIIARAKNLKYEPYYDWANSRLMWKSVSVDFVER